MKTLSYLSPEEQQKYKERQSVSWLYQKPPGMDAADKPKVRHPWCTPHSKVKVRVHVDNTAQRLTHALSLQAGEADEGTTAVVKAGEQSSRTASRQSAVTGQTAPALGPGHVKNMISAVSALQAQESFQLTAQHGLMGRRSPPRGGSDPAAANQQILASSDEELDAADIVAPSAPTADTGELKKKRKSSKRQRLQEAERFLMSHGIDPRAAAQSGDPKQKHKKKKPKS